MSRKRCNRKPITPRPPKGLRPMIAKPGQINLKLMHWQVIDSIAKGTADKSIVWDWAKLVLTWRRAAEQTGIGEPEMDGQLELVERVIDRLARTGRIGFAGLEYQEAKRGCEVMDALVEAIERFEAGDATLWATGCIDRIAASFDTRHVGGVSGGAL